MGRRLYRSRKDRVLGGVAAGLGHYFGIDPTIVRLAWVLLTLWGGAGVLLYIIAWIVVPEHPGGHEAAAWDVYDAGPRRVPSPEERRTLGWLLIAAGGAVLLFGTPFFRVLFTPSVIIGGGLLLWGLFTIGKNERPPRVR